MTHHRYYKDWVIDNEVTFGAINSKHGVIEFVSQGDNPVGLAAPSVAVRGGSMLIAFSYSGPYNVPMTNGGIKAYPGAQRTHAWWWDSGCRTSMRSADTALFGKQGGPGLECGCVCLIQLGRREFAS